MRRRDFYEVLGLPFGAAPGDIKRAYRRLAFAVHPDVGERPDPERFREVHDAYEVLRDPERRRAYDINLRTRTRRLSAEPLSSSAPVRVREDFFTAPPPIEELLSHLERNFFGSRRKSSCPYRALRVEAILEPEEARFGCRVPFDIPYYAVCKTCRGHGEWWALCADCNGRGMVESAKQVLLEIPPGSRAGERYEIDLGDFGIDNLLLVVRVVVS